MFAIWLRFCLHSLAIYNTRRHICVCVSSWMAHVNEKKMKSCNFINIFNHFVDAFARWHQHHLWTRDIKFHTTANDWHHHFTATTMPTSVCHLHLYLLYISTLSRNLFTMIIALFVAPHTFQKSTKQQKREKVWTISSNFIEEQCISVCQRLTIANPSKILSCLYAVLGNGQLKITKNSAWENFTRLWRLFFSMKSHSHVMTHKCISSSALF